ncbi:MAG: hypothetical protein ABIQ86_16620 [Steroidobacteraceae bacterium]
MRAMLIGMVLGFAGLNTTYSYQNAPPLPIAYETNQIDFTGCVAEAVRELTG